MFVFLTLHHASFTIEVMFKDTHGQSGFALLPIIGAALVLVIIYAIGNSAYQQFLAKEQQVALTPTTNIPPKSVYVAMGDSYSAGGGADRTPENPTIDVTVYDTSTKCYRSKNAAQYLVAKERDYTLIDATCGGAVTDNILSTDLQDQPPQLTKLTSDTKLVTMTIGGNDTALLYALNCMQTSDCENNVLMAGLMNLRIHNLPTNLTAIYQRIKEKAPQAAIRHAGYPYILAAPGEPAGTCSAWLTAGEQKTFHEFLTATNNKIKQTIEEFAKNNSVDAKYVDPLAADSPFMQRDAGQLLDGCSTSMKRYMNGPNDTIEGTWHPNIYGQRHYADLYEKSL